TALATAVDVPAIATPASATAAATPGQRRPRARLRTLPSSCSVVIVAPFQREESTWGQIPAPPPARVRTGRVALSRLDGMPVNPDLQGRSYPPTAPVAVTEEHVAAFA